MHGEENNDDNNFLFSTRKAGCMYKTIGKFK